VKKVLLILALCLGYSPLWAQSQSSASLNFVVVIPRFTEVTADMHPPTTSQVSEQKLELRTSVKGTCVQLTNQGIGQSWSVTGPANWSMRKNQNGYLFCASQIGHLSLNLTHQFGGDGKT
jgi:hypothetical protein